MLIRKEVFIIKAYNLIPTYTHLGQSQQKNIMMGPAVANNGAITLEAPSVGVQSTNKLSLLHCRVIKKCT